MTHMSELTPGLPLVWDSTMLSELMFCPTKFQYGYREGWRGSSVDLEFGGYIAAAFETYKKARLDVAIPELDGHMRGDSKGRATLAAVRQAMTATWRDGDPWGGTFEEQWHCAGTEKYINSKGHRAKCPYAHKGCWFPLPMPVICGECGSATEAQMNFISDHYAKNRVNLIRAIVWWCEEQPEVLEDGAHPYTFADGTPAVELFVSVPLPFTTEAGERFVLAGHLDEITEYGDQLYVSDNKSTKKPLDENFFSSYAPNVQFDTYDLLAKMVYPDLPIHGVIIDAIQLLKDAVRTAKYVYYKTDEQREEHLDLIGHYLTQAEQYALFGYWPMNKRNCGFCEFRTVCAQSPEMRTPAAFEAAGFTKQPLWSPIHKGETK